MSTASWFLLVGILLLLMGFTVQVMKRLPVTSSMIYLAIGIFLGPTVLGFYHFNPLQESSFLEIFTEAAVLISLFSAGVKMPVPFKWVHWQAPLRLAFLSMSLTVGLVAVFAYFVLGLPLGAGVLLGAIVAPTDPVLATDVQVRHPGDKDQFRFTLTSEAGMNDGSAFPFVMLGLGLLGLHDLGKFGVNWLVIDLLWATIAAGVVGVIGGYALGVLVSKRTQARKKSSLLDDFLGLGLICSVYGLSVLVDAWGFLAVFVAAVALRQTELHLQHGPDDPKETIHDESSLRRSSDYYRLSEASLIFKEHLERLSELVLVLLIGGSLFVDSWSFRAVGFAAFLFLVARPLSVYVGLLGTDMPRRIRCLTAWFGVRGIGSLYYLMYAIQHGVNDELSLELLHFTLVVVTLSIFIHGVSVKPIINKFWGRFDRVA